MDIGESTEARHGKIWNIARALIITIIIVLSFFGLVAFSSYLFANYSKNETVDESAIQEITNDSVIEQTVANEHMLRVYVDPDTGVNYVYIHQGYSVAMSVRYDTDGSIYTSDISNE